MVDHIERSGLLALQEKILQGTTGRRLLPSLSINALADCCLQRKEPPDETEDFDMVPCPLREQVGCAVYEVRPLACRILWSVERCEERGEAVMAPALVSLNGVFQQIVEDLDAGGLYGNMIDLFIPMNDRTTRDAYREGQALTPSPPLLETRPNPGFLVIPEHRSVVKFALNALWGTTVEGLPFREARERLRNERFL